MRHVVCAYGRHQSLHGTSVKYNAFISYSHATDDALAPALQSALHAFARPWNHMRALHVFRDQTSLAASPELWPAIESALTESTHLLLLASPAAAASRWVAREIEWWLANRSPSTMLVLLTDGELAWDEGSADFDWTRTTSLPREVISGRLRGEPLWVDLRWTRGSETLSLRNTRFRSAVLDIAAPLHGKDKDALDGEDVRAFARMQRVRRAAIAGLATLTLAAGIAAVVAVRQRDEAVKQTAIAQAGRLAAQADLLRERGGETDASVLLASQALGVLASVDESSFEADLSLRRAVAEMPRELAVLDVTGDALRLSPSGEFMLVESTGGQVSVLAVPSGERRSCDRMEIDAKSEPATAVRLVTAASTNGDWCVMQEFGANNQTALSLWSARPLTRVDRWQLTSKAGHLHPAISDDGDLLVTTDRAQSGAIAESTLRLWSRSRHAEVLRIDGDEFRGFSPDRRHIATTTGLWSLPDSGSRTAERVVKWNGEPWHLAFSRSGAYAVTRASHDGIADLWDIGERRIVRSFTPPAGAILALRDDGRFVVVQVGSRTVIADTETEDSPAGIPIEAKAAAFGTHDPVIVVRDVDRIGLTHVRVLTMPSAGCALATTELPTGASADYFALRGDHLDAIVTTDSALQVMRWKLDAGGWATSYTLPAPGAFDISRDGTHFAVASDSGVVVARTDGAGKPRAIHGIGLASLVGLSAEGDYLVQQLGDGGMLVNHLSDADGDAVSDAVGEKYTWVPQLAAKPSAIMISRDGSHVVALLVDDNAVSRAGPLHTLVRMGLSKPNELTTVSLGRYLTPLTSLCMVSDDAMFVRAGGVRHQFVDGTTALQVGSDDLTECTPPNPSPVHVALEGSQLVASDARTGKLLARLDHIAPVLRASVSADGRRVATVDERGIVHVFALDAHSLVEQACAREPRSLTAAEWTQYLGATTATDACGRSRPEDATPDRPPPQP
jgi:hypothetical protein